MLCRWAYGWAEVVAPDSIAAHGRREGLLGIGAVTSLDAVVAVGSGQLEIFADMRVQFTTTVETQDEANMPYFAVGVGDTVLAQDDNLEADEVRVLSMEVTEDAEGYPIFQPQLNDIVFDQQQRFAEAIKKMSNGTVGGQSTVAQPASFVAQPSPNCCAPAPPAPPHGGG